MAGELSSLGMGSGVLTYDIIDQLREADEAKIVGPTEKKLEESIAKEEALDELMELISDFEDLQDDLSDEITWLNRKTEVTGDEAEVDVTGGVNPQTINLHIDQLAKQDILQSKSFATRDYVVVSETTVLDVFIDEKSYSISLDAGTKLSDLAAKFSSSTDGAIVGSALNVGGEDPFKLILKSGEAGENNRILMGNTKMGGVVDLENLPTGDLSQGFLINGVDILGGKTKDDVVTIDDVVDLINAKQDETKVTSYVSKDGTKIILNNANGDVIDFTGSDFATGGVLDKLGLDGDTLNKKEVSVTGDTLSDFTTTFASGSLEINGVDIFEDFEYYNNGTLVDVGPGSDLYVDFNNLTGQADLEKIASAINSKTADWYDDSGVLQKGTGVSVEVVGAPGAYSFEFSSEKNMALTFTGSALTELGIDNHDVANTTTTSTSDDIDFSSPMTINQYSFYINNKQIFSQETVVNDLDELVQYINDKESLTGVTAVRNGDGIDFTNASGGSISFNQTSGTLLEDLKLENQGVGGSQAQSNLLELLEYDHNSIYDNGYIGQTSAYDTGETSRVQTPQDAIFYFNGVRIERHTNEVDDLIVGAEIKLLKVHDGDDDITKVEVLRDDEDIKEKFKEAMEKYNEMNEKIMELIAYDYETKEVGALQGVQEVTSITSIMNNHLLTYDVTLDNYQSMIALGLEIERDGKLKIDFEKFNEELDDNPEEIEKLFRGYDTVILGEDTFIDGIWTKINASLDDIISNDDSSLQVLKDNYEKEQVKYEEEIDEAKLEIEAKYERMATKFGAYDGMIANMQNSFAPFQQMMAAAYA
jgi:flagellar capping protein FliD